MKVYQKIGRKYKELGDDWEGFPADGLWQVRDGKHNNILLISAEDKAPIFALPYRTHRDDLCKLIMDRCKSNHNYSLHDFAQWACDYFAIELENQTGGTYE